MDAARIIRHLCAEGSGRRQFPSRVLDAIQHAVASGERTHQGQVCFAIEGALPLGELWRDCTPRERATQLFAHLRVWDTEHNSGVLIYLLLADRAIEIVADRGIAARVDQAAWAGICAQMRERLVARDYERGAVEGVGAVAALLAEHFPAQGGPSNNELPDRPILI